MILVVKLSDGIVIDDSNPITSEEYEAARAKDEAAIIELKADVECSEDEIAQFCMELPRYKRPRKIIFAKVPRNPTGKIEKPKLRKIYGGEGLVDSQNRS